MCWEGRIICYSQMWRMTHKFVFFHGVLDGRIKMPDICKRKRTVSFNLYELFSLLCFIQLRVIQLPSLLCYDVFACITLIKYIFFHISIFICSYLIKIEVCVRTMLLRGPKWA